MRECGRLLAGGLDFQHLLAGGRVAGQSILKQVAVADDGREQVIKVVRNAAGQPADGLHLLGLANMLLASVEGILGQPALGDVVHRQHDHAELMDAAAPQHEGPVPDSWKVPLDFGVRERGAAL